MLAMLSKVWLSDDPLAAFGVAFAANENPLMVVVGSAPSVSLERTDAMLARSTLEKTGSKMGEYMVG